MDLNVSEINGIYKKNINFKSEIKEEAKDNNPVKEEEKSFYERNKKAIIALGVIGAAAIALGTHHCLKNKHTEKLSEAAGDAASDAVGKAQEKVNDTMNKKATDKLKEFKEKLGKLSDNEDATAHIKSVLSDDNQKLKIEAISHLFSEEGKHINANNWEEIFNTLISIKPSENIKSDSITSKINKLYDFMLEKEIANPETIDKIIAKIPDAQDEIKLNIAQKLIETAYKGDKTFETQLSNEQTKKIINLLNGIKQEKFDYTPGGMISYKGYSTAGLKYEYNSKYFKEQNLDENFIKEIKDTLNDSTLTDELKLQLSDDIYMAKFCGDDKENSKEGIRLAKELLNAFDGNKAEKYSKPNSFITFTNDKFSLGCRLFSHASTYDDFGVFTTAEQLKIVKNLKEMSKNVEINTSILGGNSHHINGLYSRELHLKTQLFFEKATFDTPADEYVRFTDDILNGFAEAKEKFIRGNDIFDGLEEELLKTYFETFRTQTYFDLSIKLSKANYLKDAQEIEKINKITDNIEAFANKHFNVGGNKYNNSGNANGSKFNFDDFVSDKTTEAKSKIKELLNKDDELKDFTAKLDDENLDANTLKNIKRKFAVKYHPDKAKDDAQRAEYIRIFQDVYSSFEILEKSLNK
ncbi:MAG: hypothetical protein BHW55_07940 [Candidatus Melainabacteria bacterium 35_41]|nr:MAG: hypothetical protein BHW55_07940 [Candidatus Melainabacteria bacterium 35_41]